MTQLCTVDVWCCLIQKYFVALPWSTNLQITQITILFRLVSKPELRVIHWQSENTIQSPGGVADTQFMTFNMTDVFFVRNIQGLFISPHDRLCWTVDMWLLVTVVEMRANHWLCYFARDWSATFHRIPQQRTSGTVRQADSCDCIKS
jgi:hypothetical protein